MFFKLSTDGKVAILIVCVDDIILTGDNIELLRLKKNLLGDFEIKDLGLLRYFVGMEFARSKAGIFVSQLKYVLDLYMKWGYLVVNLLNHHVNQMGSYNLLS